MADVGSEDAYINITPICKYFGKRAQHFLSLPNTKEYIQIVEKQEDFKSRPQRPLKQNIDNKSNKNNSLIDAKKPIELVIKKPGKYNGYIQRFS